MKPFKMHDRRAMLALMASATVGMQCSTTRTGASRTFQNELTIERDVALATIHSIPANDPERQAREHPLAYLRDCLEHYRSFVRDYSCTFVKQERVGANLKPEQITEVRFRERPVYSVNMRWTHNEDAASHVLYVEDRWEDERGNDQAYVVPGGMLKLLGKLKQPIHGDLAKSVSRRTIDQFGFGKSLELILHYCEKAYAEGQLTLRMVGETTVNGREAYVFERLLPYTGQEEVYPDRLLRFCVDKEWRVPVVVYQYADDAGDELLGRYALENVSMNPGLPDSDFEIAALDRK